VAELDAAFSRPLQAARVRHAATGRARFFERMGGGNGESAPARPGCWWGRGGFVPSASPGPTVVKIVLAKKVRAVEEVLVELEVAGGWILEVADCIEEHLRDLRLARRALQRLAQRGRSRDVAGHDGCERRELQLIVVDENGAVL